MSQSLKQTIKQSGTIKLYDEFDTRYTLNRLMITLLIMSGENELYSNELNKKLNTLKSIFDPSLIMN